jgi:DNA-binding GntR family transcriptional regulator
MVEGDGLDHRTRAAAIAAALRELILRGELTPGQRLRQTELAETFAVSTTPVREALTALAREGLVRRTSHRGVVVFKPSLDELAEIYEIRGALEPFAAGLAASQLSDASLVRLREIFAATEAADPVEHSQLNIDFHGLIYTAAARPRLLELIENLRQVASAYLSLTVRHYDADYAAQVYAEHESILVALEQRDEAAAVRAVARHLRNNEAQVAKLIAIDAPIDE